MKKVLFFHHMGIIGGAGISGLNVVNSLNKSEYDVTVFCNTSHSEGMSDLFKKNGYKVIDGGSSPKIILHFSGSQLPIYSPFFLKCVYDVFRDASVIKQTIKTVNPDIVVINSMTLFWIAIIAKKLKKDTILFFRETYIKGLLGFRTSIIKHIISRYVNKVAFISNYENNLSKNIKSFKKTIYNAVNNKVYEGLDRAGCRKVLDFKTDEFYILYLGGMIPYKGANVAIEAMRFIKNPKIKLVFVGYEWNGQPIKLRDKKGLLRKIKYLIGLNYESNTINKIIENKLQSKIQFYPNQRDIAPFYKACDCLIQPIVEPHQARPVFEAGYSKIPVVITDFPQIRELCDETNTYLFQNKNPEMLATRVKEIYNDKIKALRKVDKNYKLTIERHNTEKYKCQINELFATKPILRN